VSAHRSVDPSVPRLVQWVCSVWETFKTQTVQIKGHLLELIRGYICGCSVCTIPTEIKAVFPILPLTDNTFNDFSSYPPPITAQNLFPALRLFFPLRLVLFENFFFPLASALFFFLFSLAPSGSLHSGPPSFFLSKSHSIFHFSPSPSSGMQQTQPAELMTPIHHPSLFTSLFFSQQNSPKSNKKEEHFFLKYIKFDSKWTRP